MKRKLLLVLILFIVIAGSYKEEIRAADSLNVVASEFSSTKKAPKFTVKFKNDTVKEGTTVLLVTYAEGNPVPRFQAYHKNVILERSRRIAVDTNGGIMSITIGRVLKDDSGEYMVIASNEMGKDTTRCTLTVQP